MASRSADFGHRAGAQYARRQAGIQIGDDLVAVNGVPMRSLFSVIHYLQQNGSKPVEVTVMRNGQPLQLPVVPALSEDDGQKNYRLGFLPTPVHVDKLPFTQAFARSIQEQALLVADCRPGTEDGAAQSVDEAARRADRNRARLGDAARQPGWTPLLSLMAMISLNLGVFNLLPIPILDGGIILLLIIESLIRRDISVRIKERIYQTAFVFLLLFAVVVIYNDLMKALPGLAHRLP